MIRLAIFFLVSFGYVAHAEQSRTHAPSSATKSTRPVENFDHTVVRHDENGKELYRAKLIANVSVDGAFKKQIADAIRLQRSVDKAQKFSLAQEVEQFLKSTCIQLVRYSEQVDIHGNYGETTFGIEISNGACGNTPIANQRDIFQWYRIGQPNLVSDSDDPGMTSYVIHSYEDGRGVGRLTRNIHNSFSIESPSFNRGAVGVWVTPNRRSYSFLED